ncbi:MAG: hypothetical protein Q9214_001879 [Letrouitia sp. 1 TL-2023]
MVEGFIAIIVSSMPTTASFFKSNAGSSHGSGIVSSVRSRFFPNHGGSGLRSGKKMSPHTSSSGGTKRSYTDSNGHPRDSTYLELKDVPSTQPIAYSNGPNRDIEEGVIEKKVVINQATYYDWEFQFFCTLSMPKPAKTAATAAQAGPASLPTCGSLIPSATHDLGAKRRSKSGSLAG